MGLLYSARRPDRRARTFAFWLRRTEYALGGSHRKIVTVKRYRLTQRERRRYSERMEERSKGRRVWDGITIVDTLAGLGGYVLTGLQRLEVPMSMTVYTIMVATGVVGFLAPRAWDYWRLRQLQTVLPGRWVNREAAGGMVLDSTAFEERLQDRKPVATKEMHRATRGVPKGEHDMLMVRIAERHHREVVTQMLAEYRRHRHGADGYLETKDLYHADTLAEWLVELADLEPEPPPELGFDPFALLGDGE